MKLFCETSHFSKLTTSKTKQFCETSSIFELDNIQNEAILRDFFNFWIWQHQKQSNSARLPSKMESWVQPDGVAPMRLAIFPLHLPIVLHLPRKIDARSYEGLHLSRKIILANLQIWCSKMQPLSGNQHPDLPTSLMNTSFVLRLPRKMHLCRSSSNVPRLPSFLEMLQNPHVLLTFDKVHNALRLPRETTSDPPKVVRTPGALTFWLRNVLRATMACTFSTSQALFRHLNVEKCSVPVSLFHFWLRNVLSATTACTFSTSQLLKVVRAWCVLYILTSKCASHHNGVQFFISHLARWLRTRRFSEPTFRPSGATNHWKNTRFHDFPTFSRIFIFFLLTLPLLWSALFYSSLLSASSHLCFSSVHSVGNLTSKLFRICTYTMHGYVYHTYLHVHVILGCFISCGYCMRLPTLQLPLGPTRSPTGM